MAAPAKRAFGIAIPIYPRVDLLDVAGPHEIFGWINAYSQDLAVTIELVAASGAVVATRDGLKLTPDTTFAACRGRQFDLLWVPGGDPDGLEAMMRDPDYLGFLRAQAAGAEWVTSVCEGALLLASAGLLEGYTVTTHWAFVPCLSAYQGVQVAPGAPRFVVDRNRVTGGGVSSGLDEALELVARIAGYDVAVHVQQVTQYFPDPPIRGQVPVATSCPVKVP